MSEDNRLWRNIVDARWGDPNLAIRGISTARMVEAY